MATQRVGDPGHDDKSDAMVIPFILIVVLIFGVALMLWLDRRAVRRR
jgi:hypothetical protein